MRIGINLYSNWRYQEVIEAFLENGIDRTFVCAEHPQFDEVMQALKKANITVDNLHAPFKGQNAIWAEDETGDRMLERFLESVDLCVKYGVKLMVAHVSNGRPMPEITKTGLERFDQFMAYAKSKGVTIAFESHRYLENVKYIIERYPEAGFCLDNGHENAFTPEVRYLPMWRDRLVATHISDNEYVCDKDMHMLPFDGTIDFTETARELARCNEDVTLMLEVKPDNHEKYKNISVKDYYAAAAKSVRRLAAMIEDYRKEDRVMDTIKIQSNEVKMIAHRGLSGIERENTNAAFLAAANRSYFGIETDVHITKDGKFVVIHDETTDRVTLDHYKINVEENDYSAVENITLPDLDGSTDRADIKIPLLKEYVKICKKYGKVCVLEVKNHFAERDLERLIEEIKDEGYLESVIFISFDLENCINLRKLLPKNDVQWLIGRKKEVTDETVKILRDHNLNLDILYTKLTEEIIKLLHSNGIKVNCWTCDCKEEAENLVNMGVDFITTNILE